MKIFLLYAQRKQRYEGEFLPELLEAIDEGITDENPAIADELLAKHRADSTFVSVEWFEMKLPAGAQKTIHDRLNRFASLGTAESILPVETGA